MPGIKPAATPIGVDAFLVVIATVAIVLRFTSRKLSDAGLWWDDWLVLAAWPFSVCISVSFLVAAWHGFGQHGGNPTFFLHVLYFDEILYNTGIALTKLSVLCFYRRIFSITRPLKITIRIVGAFVIAWWISFTMSSILQCVPIPAYWNPKIKAVCVYKYGFFLGQAIPNIMIDFVLLLLPLHPLWKLNMKRSQRVALVIVFILGYLNPVVSIVRIVSFIQLGNKTGEDINYGFTAPALWSAAEVAIAIFSGSIPSLTHLFRRALGSRISSAIKRYAEHHGSKDSYGGRSNDGTDGAPQSKQFQKLRDEGSHIDNLGLVSNHADALASMWEESDEGTNSHALKQIKVRNDVDIRYDTPLPV